MKTCFFISVKVFVKECLTLMYKSFGKFKQFTKNKKILLLTFVKSYIIYKS